MNAYELAKQLEERHAPYEDDAANMLRQQADRIAELEKESANLEQSLKNALVFIDNHKQTKPLSDEEISQVYKEISEPFGEKRLYEIHDFARAIEERHGIK